MIKANRKYWKTKDLYTAAYLFARHNVLVGIEADERKAAFTFLDTLDRQNAADEFRSGIPLIDARIYICALRTLKSKAMDVLMQSDGRDQ